MKSQTVSFEKDLEVYSVEAVEFPNGVQKAHESLHAYFDYSENRRYFGLSQLKNDGNLTYWAAVETRPDDDIRALKLETRNISKGNYKCIELKNFMSNIDGIGEIFGHLLKDPDIDTTSVAIEEYTRDGSCLCMMKIK
ncbi:MAG TPA: hypothetical protein VGF79_14140 [Bacteroidia bacterium]